MHLASAAVPHTIQFLKPPETLLEVTEYYAGGEEDTSVEPVLKPTHCILFLPHRKVKFFTVQNCLSVSPKLPFTFKANPQNVHKAMETIFQVFFANTGKTFVQSQRKQYIQKRTLIVWRIKGEEEDAKTLDVKFDPDLKAEEVYWMQV